MKRILLIWWPVAAWMVVIFLFSSSSDPYRAMPRSWKEPRAQVSLDGRKTEYVSLAEDLGRNGHVLEYTLLGFLMARSLRLMTVSRHTAALVALSTALCFFYGLSDEIHQVFIPSRAFQLTDLLLDSIGALVGSLIASWVFKRK